MVRMLWMVRMQPLPTSTSVREPHPMSPIPSRIR